MENSATERDFAQSHKAERPMGHVALREVLVDFLGSLVPGIIFSGAATAFFVWPALLCVDILVELLIDQPRSSASTQSAASPLTGLIGSVGSAATFWVLAGMLVITVSYVLGHLFYRQDPKAPDRASFETLLRIYDGKSGEGLNPKNLKDWVVHEPNKLSCEFPYPNLAGYLRKRGASELVEKVTWDPNNEDEKPTTLRTKNFINALKIRLEFYFPLQYVVIARNEAHVRLMSSSWYMSNVIRKLSIIGISLCATVTAVALSTILIHSSPAVSPASVVQIRLLAATLVLTCIGLAFTSYLKQTIEKFFHYQRVREVMFVLETALTADPDGRVGIWSRTEPRSSIRPPESGSTHPPN